jgi:hypothetical protein
MPDGIVDQIIKATGGTYTTKKGIQVTRSRNPYRDPYETTKARKLAEGYPKIRAHLIARVVVAKAVEGDLLMEWKRRWPLEEGPAIENRHERPASSDAAGG